MKSLLWNLCKLLFALAWIGSVLWVILAVPASVLFNFNEVNEGKNLDMLIARLWALVFLNFGFTLAVYFRTGKLIEKVQRNAAACEERRNIFN